MKTWITSVRAILVFTFLTGVIYPAVVTLAGWGFLYEKSRGSLITYQGTVLGSELIAQSFTSSKYFWPRPSAVKYDAASSGASNQGVTSAELAKAVQERKAQGLTGELLYASGSGLDPHISPEAALAQIERVSKGRGLEPQQRLKLEELVAKYTEDRQWRFLGEPRVNVLNLNLALDAQFGK